MPKWVDEAVAEFSKRLKDGTSLKFIELPLNRRGKSADLFRILEKEKSAMQAAIPPSAYVIAMDVTGKSFSSETLAHQFEKIQLSHSHLCFLIGGPEGLSSEIISKSDEQWSLSKLTLPHTIARIVLIEAIYRAITIMNKHPYHK